MRKLHIIPAALAVAAAASMLPGIATAQEKLIVGMPTTPPNVVHMPVLVAKEFGYYDKCGLTVEPLALDGGVKVFRAMVAGNVDVAMAPGAITVVGRSKGVPVKGILSNLDKFEASMVVRDNVKTMADLKGKRIGIQQPGGFADILSKNVLRRAKVDFKDVNFVSIATEDVPALVADQIDTAILHVEQEILAQQKVPSIHAIARMWELSPKQLYQFMAVTEKTIKEKSKALQCFVNANIEATRTMYKEKDKVIPIIVKATGYPKDVVEKTYDFMVKSCIWNANTGLAKDRVEFTSNLMEKVGNIEKGKAPSFEDVVDTTFAKQAMADLGEWDGPVCKSAAF